MTLTIKPEIRDLWADALESGEYSQTKGVLHRPDGGFCCLGVLCHLAVKAGVIGEPEVINTDDNGDPVFTYGSTDYEDYSHTGLPVAVAEWAGLHEDNEEWGVHDPRLTHSDGKVDNAASWNDQAGASFADIAVMVRAIPAPAPVVASV